MAIYHFSVQTIGRADGRSAVAAAAYRAAEKLADLRTGTVADYTRKHGVASTHILLPATAPAEYGDRATLWNAVEKSETRVNSRVAREIDIALPVELTVEQQRELVLDFVQQTFVSAGMCADVALHDLYSDNPHAHVLLTTRNVDSTGFTTKNRAWNDKNLLVFWRESWADFANAALAKHGHSERIDHRTLAEQGIDREPQIHLGPRRHAMQKKGIALDSLKAQTEQRMDEITVRRAAHEAAKEAELLEQITQINEQILEIENAIEAEQNRVLEREIEEAERRHSEARSRMQELGGEQRGLEATVSKLEETVSELAEYERRTKAELGKRRVTVGKQQPILQRIQSDIGTAKAELGRVRAELRRFEAARGLGFFARRAGIRRSRKEIKDLEPLVAEAKAEQRSLKQQIAEESSRQQQLERRKQSLTGEIESLETEQLRLTRELEIRERALRLLTIQNEPIEPKNTDTYDDYDEQEYQDQGYEDWYEDEPEPTRGSRPRM